MKKLLWIGVLTGMMATSVAMAIPTSGTIQAVQTYGSSYSDGGQFTAWVNGDTSTAFQTFCIETQNTFSPNGVYNYVLQQDTHNVPPGATPLKLGTAWLFSQFAAGTLAGYTGTSLQAGELQAALWYFQTQVFPNNDFLTWGNGTPGTGLGFDSYTKLAIDTLGANVLDPSAGAYGVSVIHLENGQDWLAVPDGGVTAMLLGMGMLSLGWVRRMVK